MIANMFGTGVLGFILGGFCWGYIAEQLTLKSVAKHDPKAMRLVELYKLKIKHEKEVQDLIACSDSNREVR